MYPCVFLAGESEFAQGSYLHGAPGQDGSRAWVDEGTRRCGAADCKFALYCGAGSPYDSFAHGASTRAPSCDCRDFEQTLAGYAAAAYRRRAARSGASATPADSADDGAA